MSRSFKKSPTVKCEKSCKFGKKVANRKVRHYLKQNYDISNGNFYRKIYNSAEVCDYKFTQYKEWEIHDWYQDQYDIINNIKSWKQKYNTSLEQTLNDWYVYYKTK